MSKDNLRSKLFSSRNQRKKLVTLEADGEQIAVEVRQPSIAVRTRIGKVSKVDSNGEARDIEAIEEGRLLAVCECCFDPESGEKLFSMQDRDSLFKQAGWYDQLANECLAMLRYSPGAAESAEKNSVTTPSAS